MCRLGSHILAFVYIEEEKTYGSVGDGGFRAFSGFERNKLQRPNREEMVKGRQGERVRLYVRRTTLGYKRLLFLAWKR